MQTTSPARCIPGTTLFDADQARKGYALNKMCFSFNTAAARQEFQQDEAAYCARFGLNAQQSQKQGLALELHSGEMTALPFADHSVDYVLAWNVIYHGDLPVVLRVICEILRVLRPKGLFQGTMLSKRNTEITQGHLIAPNTYINNDCFEKRHPHYYCTAPELIALFNGFEPLVLQDVEHSRAGSFHWQILAEKTSL